MGKPLRVLVAEDSEDDALLVIRELERGGYDAAFERVETAEAMTAALKEQAWDVIIADYRMPNFSAPAALKLTQGSGLDLPFIIISGTIGEDTAVEAMRSGAHDYMMKGNLMRLVPAIERELNEAEVRKERKKAEEGIRVFSNTIASSINAVAIADLEGNLTYVNKSFLRMWDYDDEKEVLGKNAVEFWQVAEEAVEVMQKALDKEGWIGELIAKRKDGSTFDVLLSASVVRDEAGRPICRSGSFIDVTERKQAEEGMKRAAEEWRTTFDAISDLISIHDSNYKITRVNRAFAEAFQMEPKELIGKTCYEVVHGASEPSLHCPHKSVLETGKPETAEFFEPHLDVYLGVSASPIFNVENEIVGAVHIAKDITERKKMEEQLIVTDRLASVGELVSGVAHEINNPLTSIIGFSELLLAADAPDAVKEDLKVINKEAQRASGIVRNLLTFARRHKPEKQAVDVNDAIQAALDLRAYEQKVNNVMTIKYFASDLPKITADGFQLRQVFLNLIINAEYFMIESHGKGTLGIKTEQDRDIIRISFADDGPGIPEENVKHLFDPFFTTKEVGKGTGLGLSICHGIITEHGGRIYAKSDLGKDATFVVELPVR